MRAIGRKQRVERRCPLALVCLLIACSGTDAPPAENTDRTRARSVYAEDALPTFEIEISDAGWAALQQDAAEGEEVYCPAAFRFRDEVLSDAMIRLRGGNSRCGDKLQFAISLQPGRSQRPVPRAAPPGPRPRRLPVLHERLAMAYLRDLGVPAPCVNNARLVVNGRYYGLFVNLEHVNKDFLERNFGEAADDGNLYKRGLLLRTNEAGGGLLRARGVPRPRRRRQPRDARRPRGGRPGVGGRGRAARPRQLLERRLELLPVRPSDARVPLHPGRHRHAVHDERVAADHPGHAAVPRRAWCSPDPAWRARFEDAVRGAIAAYDFRRLRRRIDRWWAQIAAAAAEDPHVVYTKGDAEELRWRVHARSEWLLGVAGDPASW